MQKSPYSFYRGRLLWLAVSLAALFSLVGYGDDSGHADPGLASTAGTHAATIDANTPEHHQRVVPLAHTLNTRDLGGYSGDAGRRVRWGLLYRSDSLAQLDEADIATLKALQLATVTDFRSGPERDAAPDRLPQQSPAIAYKTLAINNPAVDVEALRASFYAGKLSAQELAAMVDRTSYIENDRLRENWGQWVRSLAQPGALPQMFHCTAGKDRTGFAAALVLLTLGVSKEEVMQDFLLSNEYLAPKIDRYLQQILANSPEGVDEQLLREVLGVSPDSLEGAFLAMEANYGSVDGFIEQGLGIDADTRAALQALLLE